MKWFTALTVFAGLVVVFALFVQELEVTEPIPLQQVVAARATDQYESVFLDLLNDYRLAQQRTPLSYNEALASVADYRINDMVTEKYYAHINPKTNKDFSSLMPSNSGYSCENLLLSVQVEPQAVIGEWLQSDSHRQCLMHSDIRFATIKRSLITSTDDSTAHYVYVFVAASY